MLSMLLTYWSNLAYSRRVNQQETVFRRLLQEATAALNHLSAQIRQEAGKLDEIVPGRAVDPDAVFYAERLHNTAASLERRATSYASWVDTYWALQLILHPHEDGRRRANWSRWQDDAPAAAAVALDSLEWLQRAIHSQYRETLSDEGVAFRIGPQSRSEVTSLWLVGLLYYEAGLRQVDIGALFDITQPAVADLLARFDNGVAVLVLAHFIEAIGVMEDWAIDVGTVYPPPNPWGAMQLTKGENTLAIELRATRSESQLVRDRDERRYIEEERRRVLVSHGWKSFNVEAIYDLSTKTSYFLTYKEFLALSARRPLSRLTSRQNEHSLDEVLSRIETMEGG
jgi:hypothetical protein